MSHFQFEIFSEQVLRHRQHRRLSVGEVLFTEGSPAESVYFVDKGCVRLTVYPQDGKELVLYRARENEVFSEDSLLRKTYGYTAIADLDTVVQAVSSEALLRDLQMNPDVLTRYLACLSGRYHQLRTNFERLGIPAAKARVLHWLVAMSEGKPDGINVSGRLKSLAGDLNLTHEAMYRALRTLEDEGAIHRSEGHIQILRTDG